MNSSSESIESTASNSVSTPSPWRGRIGFAVGIILLGLAGAYVLADRGQLDGFLDSIRSAPRWATLVVLVGPIVNWLCVGLCLHALMRRHGMVGRREMLSLVGSAWLLNHLPMRPGLVGRVGYHAKVNKIRVRDSIQASIWSLVHAAIANAISLGIMLLVPSDISVEMLVLVLLIPLGVFGILAGAGFLRDDRLGFLLLGLCFRHADMLVWMVRYAAAFAMLGVIITPIQIALITAVSQIAQLVPITGGGLGVREWGVGVTARFFGGAGGASGIAMRTAIGADVINRVAETIIVIPLGLICTGMVARRVAVWNRTNESVASVGSSASAEDHSGCDPEEQDEPGQACQ